MANVIQTMIHDTLGDGARSTKFDCLIGLDSYKKGSKMISTFVKTASFPGKSHEVIDLKFKGRNIPVRGQTKYENTWSCTFYLDEMHSLKKAFEDEIEMLDIHSFGNISLTFEGLGNLVYKWSVMSYRFRNSRYMHWPMFDEGEIDCYFIVIHTKIPQEFFIFFHSVFIRIQF